MRYPAVWSPNDHSTSRSQLARHVQSIEIIATITFKHANGAAVRIHQVQSVSTHVAPSEKLRLIMWTFIAPLPYGFQFFVGTKQTNAAPAKACTTVKKIAARSKAGLTFRFCLTCRSELPTSGYYAPPDAV
jgi:hypothetical protein